VGLKARDRAQWRFIEAMMRAARAIPKPLWWLADFFTPKE
jgi:hypothetical protein